MFIPGEMSLTPGGNRFLDLRQLTDSHLLLALGLGELSLQLVAYGSDVGGQSFCVSALLLVLGSVAAPFGPPTHPFVARLKRCRSAGHGRNSPHSIHLQFIEVLASFSRRRWPVLGPPSGGYGRGGWRRGCDM